MTTEPFSEAARRAWRTAALAVGVPALAALVYLLVLMVVGFPISLVLVPFAAPVIAVSLAQVKASIRTWQGLTTGATRLRNTSAAVTVVIAGLLVWSVARGDDGVQRDASSLRQRAIEKAIVVAVLGLNALAVGLLLPTTPRPEPATLIAKAAGLVLVFGVLAATFLPRAHYG